MVPTVHPGGRYLGGHPISEVVRRRQAQSEPQRRLPSFARRAAQPHRDHMGRRRRRGRAAHLRRTRATDRTRGERAQTSRRRQRRSRRALHADDSRDRNCGARRRAYRRDFRPDFFRVRCGGGSSTSYRLAREGSYYRRRILSPRPNGRARSVRQECRANRRHRRKDHRRAAHGRSRRRRPSRGLLGRNRRGRVRHMRARTDGEHGSVHAHLHLRHDREAQGHRALPRGLPAQGRAGHGAFVRPARGRGDVLVHRHGWMMGPWLIIGALTLGATALLYEGAPDYPSPDRIWSIVAHHRVTHLGISPTLVRGLLPNGVEPVKRHDLSSLRVLGSTGEVWNPEAYMWLFENVGKRRCPIINYSGGTEIAGGLLGCTVFRPIKPCGFNTAVPGIEVAALDDDGEPVVNAVGELAALNPWPGMTKGFWEDPARYLDTYWSRFEGIWVHGDWALRDAGGHWFLLGRSDDTLKIAGKRLGPAEVESAAAQFPGVKESAAIGIPHATKGEVPVLFAVLMPGYEPSPKLAGQVADKIAEVLGKPLRPQEVYFVPDLPRTRNAKIMRRVVRAVHLGKETGDLSGLENPGALDHLPRAKGRSE